MKKILIILVLSLTFINCNDNPTPVDIKNSKYSKEFIDKFEKIDTIGDTIIAYVEGNQIYYKDNKNRYYNAHIISNTTTSIVSDTFLIISVVLMILVGIFLIITAFSQF